MALHTLALPLASALTAGAKSAALAPDADAWLAAHAHPIVSVDPAHADDSDLEPLRAIVGDARIVLIGEASHQAGTDMLARARMIRWLRDELGFGVVLIESGLGDVKVVQDALDAGEPVEEAAPRGIFSLWSGTEEGLAGLREAADGMMLLGYDAQTSGPRGSAEPWRPLLATALAAADALPEAERLDAARRERLDGAIERISDGVHAKMVTVQRVMGRDAPMPASLDGLDLAVEYGRLADDLDALTAALGAPSGDDLGLATRAAASLAAFSRNLALETQAGFWSGPELFAESFTRRDRAGADNVLWVARELAPDERIVVWAHDAHVSKAHVSAAAMVGAPPEQSVGPRPGFGVPLGRHLADAMGDDVVSIGFVGSRSDALNRGPAGAPGVQASGEDRPVEGSLEQLCSEATDAAHLLVDLRAGELPFSICGPIDHAPVAMDDWSKAYDALFWSRVVLPSSE